MATRQPFLFQYPKQVRQFFLHGSVTSPNRSRWDFNFTPGLMGSVSGFCECVKASRKCFKWAWTVKSHLKIVKFVWNETGVRKFWMKSVNRIKAARDSVLNGGRQIKQGLHSNS